ncbi:MAG: nicotinamidase-like amidase [Chloroflexi bacterium]|nr:nicotinamidase-like amidase [Chloroflexota bacterium]
MHRSAILATPLAMLTVAVGALVGLGAPAASAQQILVPPTPDPVAVSLDGSTTAVVVSDLNQTTCAAQPICAVGVVSAVAPFLAKARDAGALVVYSTGTPVLDEVAPESGDAVIRGAAQDRFFSTALDEMLRARGVVNVVVVGWSANGSVLYTSYGGGIRGYTVVVPVDGTSASNEADAAIGRYQMLRQLGGNPTNEPLIPGKVTLSRTDLISFE